MAKKKVRIPKSGIGSLTSYGKLSQKEIDFIKERKKSLLDAKARRVYKEERIKDTLETITGGRVSAPIRKIDNKASSIARTLINLAAPKGGLVKAVTSPSKKGQGKGRGRPSGTFKTRMLPSGKVVKVHTNVYKKMLSQEKAQMRLVRAQRQFEAEQVATQQDPRFQQGADDQFLAEPDQIHEMNVMRAQQEQERSQFQPQEPQFQQKQQGMISRAMDGISRLGGSGRAQAQQVVGYDEYGRPMVQQMQQQRPQIQDMRPREPKVNVLSAKSSILNAPSIFNNPGQSNLAKRRSLI